MDYGIVVDVEDGQNGERVVDVRVVDFLLTYLPSHLRGDASRRLLTDDTISYYYRCQVIEYQLHSGIHNVNHHIVTQLNAAHIQSDRSTQPRSDSAYSIPRVASSRSKTVLIEPRIRHRVQ